MTLESIKEKVPLNWGLLGNPVNWAIVVLMVAIAGIAVYLIFSETVETKDVANGNR